MEIKANAERENPHARLTWNGLFYHQCARIAAGKFPAEQRFFTRAAVAIGTHLTVFADDAVAGDNHRQWVAPDRLPYRRAAEGMPIAAAIFS